MHLPKFIVITLLVVCATGAMNIAGVGYRHHQLLGSVTMLSDQTYSLIAEHIEQLRSEPDLTLLHRELLADIDRLLPRMRAQSNVNDRILTIAEIRQSIAQFIAYTPADSALSRHVSFEAFRGILKEESAFMEDVDIYNTNAHSWNNQWDSWISFPIMNIFGMVQAPLIDAEGNITYEMTINL